MILYIDTTNSSSLTFALSTSKGILKKTYKLASHNSHQTLAKLEEFLKLCKIKMPQSQISNIIVNKGPGSYTGTRVGITHALALGFAWNVPVKFIAKNKFVIR